MSQDAIDTFAQGDPSVDAARALKGADPKALLALVAELAKGGARAHLEALGAAGLGKDVKKAARKAAYTLKSAGVGGDVARSGGMVAADDFDLAKIALVGAPGLDGQSLLVVLDLPGVQGGQINLRSLDEPVVEVLEDLSRRRVRRAAKEGSGGRAMLANADLAVRRIERLESELGQRPGGASASLSHFLRWRDKAIALGADGARASARAQLGPAEDVSEADYRPLFEMASVGRLLPTEAVASALEDALGAIMHDDDAIDQDAFMQMFHALTDGVANGTLEQAGMRERLAAWMEDNGDVLYALGDNDNARIAVGLADALMAWEGKGADMPFLRDVFRATFDAEAAWQHRQDHVAGHAHHHHEHG